MLSVDKSQPIAGEFMASEAFKKLKENSRNGFNFRRMRLSFLRDFDWQSIERLISAVGLYVESPLENRLSECGDDDFMQLAYEEETIYSQQIAGLVGELSIIALYKKVEIDTKAALGIVYPSEKTDDWGYWDRLEGFLKRKMVEISELDGYLEVNELRLVNNAIKHGGVVDKKLSKKYPAWIEGKKLSNMDEHFYRLLPGVENI